MAPTAEDAASAARDAVEMCLHEIDRWIPVLGDFLGMITDSARPPSPTLTLAVTIAPEYKHLQMGDFRCSEW